MLTHKFRFVLATLAILSLVSGFAVFSRYPDLNRKALTAENHGIDDPLSTWPVVRSHAGDPAWKRIAYTTINWANENKKGMAFGLALAGLLSVWLGYLRIEPRGRLRSAVYGMVLGTPLGVCVNCAAPVFKAALRSRRIEMALALMFASPTLNVVVLTMAFTLLPFYMALTKLLFNLFVILIGVPLLARWLKDIPLRDLQHLEQRLAGEPPPAPGQESFATAALEFAKDFSRQLWTIVYRTAPLMLVAGVLGAALSQLVPLSVLRGQSGPLPLLLAATVGLMLPVPMAFDVVLTHALFTAGLPQDVALVLLLCLGIYSLYSFMITWQSASRRWALAIAAGLWVSVLPIGLLAPLLHELYYLRPNLASYRAQSRDSGRSRLESPPGTTLAATAPSIKPEPSTRSLKRETTRVGSLRFTALPFLPKLGSAGKFVQHEGYEIGISKGFMYTLRDYPDPFWVGRGTTAGDFDKDGWLDVALGSDQGPVLYRNLGGRFVLAPLNIPALRDARVFSVAFVDLDGDSWPDLFVSTFHRGNYWIRNLEGRFAELATAIPNGDAVLTVSPAFADIDRDGRIDIFNGNMVLGIATGVRAYGPGRRNGFSWNKPDGFKFQPLLDEDDGETMASLLSDIDGDGYLDLYENNDFSVPDYLYFGRKGGFQRLKAPATAGFATPMFSMSVDTADVNNDLRLDLLVTGTLAASQALAEQPIDGVEATEYKRAKDSLEYCDRIKDLGYRANCQLNRHTDHLIPFHRLKNLDVSDCQKLADVEQRDSCLLSMMWMIVTNNDDQSDCKQRYGFDPQLLEVCRLMRAAGPYHRREQYAAEAPQIDKAVLYLGQADGGLARAAQRDFDHPGGWTWSSRFADLDNDGWVDIFNAEGAVSKSDYGWNVYMHNQRGRFVQRQFSAGLTNDFNLFSFVIIDYDHDGDLDIIGNGSEGPPQVYENQLDGANHSIAFALDSARGNTANLNAKLIIHPKSGPAQMREIKAGGGYQNIDAPIAFFGLGADTELSSLEIRWPDGQRQELAIQLKADALYRVEQL